MHRRPADSSPGNVRRVRDPVRVVGAILFVLIATTISADEALPDLEFLEYLGQFADDEADWMALADEKDSAELASRLEALGAAEKNDETDETTDDE